MDNVPRISEAEYEVMKVIWDNNPISTNEVVAAFENKSDWSPKTIQTMLSRLVKKGVLAYEKRSRVFVYTPVIAEKDYINDESRSFLKKFYDGALNSMVLNFIEQDKLTDREIDELKRILEKRNVKGEK